MVLFHDWRYLLVFYSSHESAPLAWESCCPFFIVNLVHEGVPYNSCIKCFERERSARGVNDLIFVTLICLMWEAHVPRVPRVSGVSEQPGSLHNIQLRVLSHSRDDFSSCFWFWIVISSLAAYIERVGIRTTYPTLETVIAGAGSVSSRAGPSCEHCVVWLV